MRELLKSKGITQMQFAEKIGVSQRLVSYWCNKERKPDIFTVLQIAEILGVTVDEVISCFKK